MDSWRGTRNPGLGRAKSRRHLPRVPAGAWFRGASRLQGRQDRATQQHTCRETYRNARTRHMPRSCDAVRSHQALSKQVSGGSCPGHAAAPPCPPMQACLAPHKCTCSFCMHQGSGFRQRRSPLGLEEVGLCAGTLHLGPPSRGQAFVPSASCWESPGTTGFL